MDFNDIKSRLDRTLASMNARFDDDYKKHTNIKFIETKGGTGVSLTFGKDSKADVEAKIFSVLHNLASLKDHLKNCLQKNGHDKNLVENEINSSLHLQVLIDLVNADKHEYPLTKTKRSNKDPIIKNAEQALKIGGTKAGDVSEATIGNDGHLIVHGVPPKITITADICDSSGNLLFNLNTLVDNCYSKWDEIAKKYNCVT